MKRTEEKDKEDPMFAVYEMARMHQQDLLREADSTRLAATVRRSQRVARRRTPSGGAAAWRRAIGWLVIDAGVWLAGGAIDAGSDA